MAKATVLLGAGASIDAGLPSAFELTHRVYEELRTGRHPTQTVLFGYIISKLMSRHVLAGGSPFDRINVEEAYDAILRLLSRERDLLAEFVYSWDPILDQLRPKFNESAFIKGIAEGLQDQTRSRQGILTIKTRGLQDSARAISAALGGHDTQNSAEQAAGIYIDILVKILGNPPGDTTYLDPLIRFCGDSGSSLATLNYDLLAEEVGERQGVRWDYGLSTWGANKLVNWTRESTKLFKLHGSINWSGTGDAIRVLPQAPEVNRWSRSNALMIFGGQSGKLTPTGPFLQLRHEFERDLLRSNRLLIIGYSFRDEHVNAILRRWVSTRKSAKMVIVEPGIVNFGLDVFRQSYHMESDEVRKTVDIVHIQKTARTGMTDALRHVALRVNLHHDRTKGGFLPHIMVTRIT
jgi:hypothetical protein